MTTILIVLPLAAAVALWVTPWGSSRAAGGFALLIALAELAFWVGTALNFDFGAAGLQEEADVSWFADLDVAYKVGLYDYSLWLVGLTALVTAAAIGYGLWVGRERLGVYLSLLLFLEGATIGVFAAQDLILFYVFWEAMLIPLYVLIGVWGGPGRLGATYKFVAYTVAGSLLMLVAIVAARARGRYVRHDGAGRAGNEHLDLPRLRRRLRREGAALAVPRLAARRLPGVAARSGGRPLRRHLEDRRLRLPRHRRPVLPGARGGLANRGPRAGVDRARLRLPACLPGT